LRNREEDVAKLALTKAGTDGVDMAEALRQIEGWQKARTKLPSYAATEGILYPPRLSMEQCSSEKTAKYKAEILKKFGFTAKPASSTPSPTNSTLNSASTNHSEDSGEPLAGFSRERVDADKFEEQFTESEHPEDFSFIDLTGGFGVDFAFMSRLFREKTIVERQEVLCDALRHNLPLLGLADAKVVCGDGIEYLQNTDAHFNVIFLDPARRDGQGRKMVSLSDCQPDAAAALPLLLEKGDLIIIKLSPMLDITKALEEMKGHCKEVHVVAVKNECKELLLVITADITPEPMIYCVNDDEIFAFRKTQSGNIPIKNTKPSRKEGKGLALQEELQALRDGNSPVFQESNDSAPQEARKDSSPREVGYDTSFSSKESKLEVRLTAEGQERDEKEMRGGIVALDEAQWLYEPNAAVMKAGCFEILSRMTGAEEIAPNSHLFISKEPLVSFPGKRYRITAISSMNSKELRKVLNGIDRAEITTRNFPMKAEELRKKLRLKDGGPAHIFATTAADGRRLLILSSQ